MSLDTENQEPVEGVADPVDTRTAESESTEPASADQNVDDANGVDSSPDISVPEYQEFTDTSGSNRAEDLARLQNIIGFSLRNMLVRFSFAATIGKHGILPS